MLARDLTLSGFCAALTSAAAGPDCVGSFTSLGYNLIGKTNDSSGFGVSQDQAGSIAAPLNPRLGPLADNGGLTLTHVLLTGSPAVDKGKAFGVITDQRGRPRRTRRSTPSSRARSATFRMLPESWAR